MTVPSYAAEGIDESTGYSLTLLVGPPPVTVQELAKMIGMSTTFIREEIHSGHIHAVTLGHGKRHVFRIPAGEVYRYIKSLGIL